MRIKYKDKLATVFLWIVIAISAVTLVIFIIWNSVYRVEEKTVSIINYFNFPVEVSFLKYRDNFEPFEVRTYTINSKEDFNVIVKKQEGVELSNLYITGLKLPKQLVQIVLSDTKDYCYFNANVTEIYNESSSNIRQINILSKNPLDYFIYGVGDQVFNIYPGSSKPNKSELNSQEIKGHYPIRCGLINVSSEIEKVVKSFKNYSHLEQIKYLEEAKIKIQNTQNIEELNSL